MKRLATNSMMNVIRNCGMKYHWRYVEKLVPISKRKTLSFGTLFHLLRQRLIQTTMPHNLEAVEFDADAIIKKWIERETKEAEGMNAQSDSQLAMFGLESPFDVSSFERECQSLADEVKPLFEYWRSVTFDQIKLSERVIWTEQTFEVPLPRRNTLTAHPVWRFAGKFDDVYLDLSSGNVIIRDCKTTKYYPTDYADLAQMDSQPIAYLYAAMYLQVLSAVKQLKFSLEDLDHMFDSRSLERLLEARNEIYPDKPVWPVDLNAPSGFELEIIRKKIPQKPECIASGKRLSKSVTDTTFGLYMQAIQENGFDPNDYTEILDRLKNRGPCFYYRQRVMVSHSDVMRWCEETRQALEYARSIELHPEKAWRADNHVCRNQFGKKCEYAQLCWGDKSSAMSFFVKVDIHQELSEEEEI